ncbi:hypothetical protein Tco_0762475 [Tanacetum coccineum]
MHRTTSAHRSPNPDVDEGESRAQQKSTVIRHRIPPRRSTRLTLPTPVPTITEVEDMTLQDIIQLSIDLRSYKESLKVEILTAEQPINVIEEEEESAEDDYELRRRVKGKHELTETDPKPSSSTPSSSSPKPTLSMSQHILSLFMPRKKFNVLAQHLQEVMEESLPNMVDDRVKELTKTQVSIYVAEGLIMEENRIKLMWSHMTCHILHIHPTQANQASAQEQQYQLYLTMKDNPQLQHDDLLISLNIKFEGLTASNTPCRSSAIRPRYHDHPHDDAHREGENSAKRQKTSEHKTYVMGESSSGQANESESDDDELPTENVSQELVEEMSETVDEAKLCKCVDEMLRQRCTSGYEHQYHIDQMQNFLKNDIVDPKALALSLVNQDLLYLKKGNPGPEKIVLSLHNVEHWKNPHAKIFYIKRQKELGKPTEVYSNLNIVQVIKTYRKFGHEHKFLTWIIARRANGSIVLITKPDYKNLNKNDIEDMYLLCINGKVDDYVETGLLWSLSVFIISTVIWERVHDFQLGVESYQQKINLTAPTITFTSIEKHKMFSIISEPIYGIIYKNIKKEKRVMRHQEIHKFCDATLKRVLEGLKSYNNDVKHGYVTPSLGKKDVEYLQLFEEEIEERLKHRDQMRRWKMYINGRPLESRRERPG